MNYAITLSNQPYTLSTSDDAQIAAIAATIAPDTTIRGTA